MKIGIIADVHADLPALDRALELLTHRHEVASIWCAGDLVGRGQQPNEVVQRVVGAGMPTVLGNHDEFVLGLRQTRPERIEEILGYSSETFRLLAALPRTFRLSCAGQRIVMVHGTPRSNTEALRLTPAYRGAALEWLHKTGADILISGHTHVPMYARSKDGLLVNPGSLFTPQNTHRSSSQTYGVLDLHTLSFSHHALWD